MPELRIPIPIIGAWIALILLLCGCAGPWAAAPKALNASHWSISPPDGWMCLHTSESDMLSKDGPFLEYILVQSRSLGQRFRFTNQKISPHMLPDEVAALITDSMRSDPFIRGFRLLSSQPALLGGHSGFKLIYSYLDQNGVQVKAVYYGVVVQDRFFNLRYTATRRYYFESRLPAFNKVVDSVRFVPDQDSDS
jgi:hypothetical protein